MVKYFIGDLLLEMDYGGMSVVCGDNLKLFAYDDLWSGETLKFHAEFEKLNCDDAQLVHSDNNVCEVYRCGDENMLVYHWGNLFHGFAVWPDRFSVSYAQEMKNQPELREDWFFSIIAFHKQMLNRGGCVFHASYIDVGGKAVLFTAPSNTGKSTQAELWRKFANAQIINGDRALMRKRNGVWHAFGYPSCGTSGICINKTLPIEAIVVLEQGSENRIESISASQKIRSLVSATEVYLWDKTEIEQSFAVAEDIISNVPVVKLVCRPDEEAVRVLQSFLEEGGND